MTTRCGVEIATEIWTPYSCATRPRARGRSARAPPWRRHETTPRGHSPGRGAGRRAVCSKVSSAKEVAASRGDGDPLVDVGEAAGKEDRGADGWATGRVVPSRETGAAPCVFIVQVHEQRDRLAVEMEPPRRDVRRLVLEDVRPLHPLDAEHRPQPVDDRLEVLADDVEVDPFEPRHPVKPLGRVPGGVVLHDAVGGQGVVLDV